MLGKLYDVILRQLLRGIPLPTNYKQLTERYEREVEILQNSCHHNDLFFQYTPFACCSLCNKIVRESTKEELETEARKPMFSINEQIKPFYCKIANL